MIPGGFAFFGKVVARGIFFNKCLHTILFSCASPIYTIVIPLIFTVFASICR